MMNTTMGTGTPTAVLVLWARQFDEMMAVTYLALLRGAGITTTLIGMQGRCAAGSLGLQLTADLALGDALPLAARCTHVIIPCHSPAFRQLANDPRVRPFLQAAHQHSARFITGHVAPADANLLPAPLHRVEMCKAPFQFEQAAAALVARLQGKPEREKRPNHLPGRPLSIVS